MGFTIILQKIIKEVLTIHMYINTSFHYPITFFASVFPGDSSNIKNEKVYIIEHREDKMGKGSHFHTADNEKGRYYQHRRHYPEDFEGYEKKLRN
ncbi:HNH/endonuclease VII fold putative polymorphic toxin [Bacillus albus]|uniref:HNH/endonuclease VII fold putative polymorphic toxin n=2 Tax=Bacillus albus TaxID=2026189 RepID=UPI003D1BA846